jgi:transposase InsO family protein
MSRKGNCSDKAAMESFGVTLQTECLNLYISKTKQQAKTINFDYIEGCYNRWHLRSALGYKSPLDYESPRALNPINKKATPRVFEGRLLAGLVSKQR